MWTLPQETQTVSEELARRERIKARIAASQERFRRESPDPAQLPADRDPPEKFTSLLAEYPGLTIAAGLGLGLLVGALLPKTAGSKLARRSTALAAAAGELGLFLARQAMEKTADAGREGRVVAGKSVTIAGQKTGAARNAGLNLVKKAMDLALNAKR